MRRIICVLAIAFAVARCGQRELGRQYNRQEFVVIHRPHLTYYVDLVYGVCFARRPMCRAMTEFVCSPSLIRAAREGDVPVLRKKGKN